jgi:hypothetical protein
MERRMHRITRPLLSLALLAATGSAAAAPGQVLPWVFDIPKGGSNCSSLDPTTSGAPPVDYGTSFEGTVRPLLQDNGCTGCHGGSGGFTLNTTAALANLIVNATTGLETGRVANVQPAGATTPMLRIKPGEPYQSSVFERINCASPPAGWPGNAWTMPLGGGASLALQAAMFDWIALGAVMPDTGGDRLFLGTFETIVRPASAP